MLAVAIVPTVRSLVRQNSDIAALREQVAAQEASVQDLTAEQERWADPAYVEAQARARLKFVRVGDRSYTVIDPVAESLRGGGAPVVGASSVSASAPWYGQLWQSVVVADQPASAVVGPSAP